MRKIFKDYKSNIKDTWGPVINYVFNTFLNSDIVINFNTKYPESDWIEAKELHEFEDEIKKRGFVNVPSLDLFPFLSTYICFVGSLPFRIVIDSLYGDVLAGGIDNPGTVKLLIQDQTSNKKFIDIASLFVVEDQFLTEFCASKEEVISIVQEFLYDNPNDEISITNTITNLTVWINKNSLT